MISRQTSRGATLIEMMIVVVILGMLATAAYWGFNGVVPGYRLGTAARDVSSLLAVTRARAISQNRYYIVEFQASAYRVIWDQDGDGVIDAGEPVTQTAAYGQGVTYQRPGTDPLPAGDIVAFNPRGLASNISVNGQVIELTNDPVRTRSIRIRYTGLVTKL